MCLAPFPLLIIATYLFKESVNKSFIRVRNAVAALNAFVQEHITGMQIVQTFTAEDREYGRFRKINKEHRNANINARSSGRRSARSRSASSCVSPIRASRRWPQIRPRERAPALARALAAGAVEHDLVLGDVEVDTVVVVSIDSRKW